MTGLSDWEMAVVATATQGQQTELPEGATIRYIAGFGVGSNGATYSVHAVVEAEWAESTTRVGQPLTLIPSMTKEQAEHLHMQLGKAIGFRDEAPTQ